MKSNVKSLTLRLVLAISVVFTVSGCASSKLPPLTDQMIKSHRGDVDGLWDAWIKPAIVDFKGEKGIPFPNGDEAAQIKTLEVFHESFGRYCADNGGTSTVVFCKPGSYKTECVFIDGSKAPVPYEFGPSKSSLRDEVEIYSCKASNGQLIGAITTVLKSNIHIPTLDSPKVRKVKEEQESKDAAAAYKKLTAGIASDSLNNNEIYDLIEKSSKYGDPDNIIPKARERMLAIAAASRAAEMERSEARYAEILAKNPVSASSTSANGCPSIRQDQIQRMERFISDFESTCRATTGRVVHGDLQFQCNLPHGTSYAIFFRRNESCKFYAVNKSNVTGEKIIQETVGYFD